MNEEVVIINDEPFYRILNGTSYDYAPIPKEFKPYFERLQQEIQQLKEKLNCDLQWALKYDELYFENKQLKEVIEEASAYVDYLRNDCKYRLNDGHLRKLKKILKRYDK